MKIWLYWSAFRTVPFGLRELRPDQQRLEPADDEEDERRDAVQEADLLVVDGREPAPEAGQRRRATDAPCPLAPARRRSPSTGTPSRQALEVGHQRRRSRSRSGGSRASSTPSFTAFGSCEPRGQRLPSSTVSQSHPAKHWCVGSAKWVRFGAAFTPRHDAAEGVARHARCPGRPRAGSEQVHPLGRERIRSASTLGCFWLATHASQSLGESATTRDLHLAVLQPAELRALPEVRARVVGLHQDVVRPARAPRPACRRAAGPRTSGSPRSRPGAFVPPISPPTDSGPGRRAARRGSPSRRRP